MLYELYEPFEKWCKNGEIWLISDTHFNDYDADGWLPAGDLIEKINASVGKSDTLICLGDCGEYSYFEKIKCGYKVLIKGNHDTDENYRYKKYFNEVYDGPLFISANLLLSHEPVYGISSCLNIHGHMHTGCHQYTDEQGARHINIVGPAVEYEPIALKKIMHNYKI